MSQTPPGFPGNDAFPAAPNAQYTPNAYPPGQFGYGSGGPQGPDHLTPMAAGAPQPKKSRKAWWIGGGVLGVAVVGGAGAFAASWFFSTGAQPAQALPADTLGYVAIDLDPSGAQKVEGLKTLQKFPAIKENLKLGADDDLRPVIFKEMLPDDCTVNYDNDVKPWLGERFAFAAIKGDGDAIIPAAVVQVSDQKQARAGLDKLAACGAGMDGKAPVAFTGEWMVLSESAAAAEKVVAGAEKAPLADDAAYQKWIDAAGGEGILTAYAAPGVGDVAADNLQKGLDQLGGFGLGNSTMTATVSNGVTAPNVVGADHEPGHLGSDDLGSDDFGTDDFGTDPFGTDEDLQQEFEDLYGDGEPDVYDDYLPSPAPFQIPEGALDGLRDFEGGALAIRFADGSVEIELSGGVKQLASVTEAPGTAGTLADNLPSDTTAVLSAAIGDNAVKDLMDEIEKAAGDQLDFDTIKEEASKVGITLPDDVQTVLGKGIAITLGGDFNAEAFENSDGPEDVPLGVLTAAPKDDVQAILDRVLAQGSAQGGMEPLEPQQEDYFKVSGDADRTIWAPNSGYGAQLEKGGDLGNTDIYREVITDRDAQWIAYANLDQLIKGFDAELANEDPEVRENLAPLKALGVTSSGSKGTINVKIKLTTD